MGILIGSWNGHIAAAAKKCFKSHLPRLFIISINFPVIDQNFVIYKPASKLNPVRLRFVVIIIRNLYCFFFVKFLLIPKPKFIYSKEILADKIDSIDKSKIIRS